MGRRTKMLALSAAVAGLAMPLSLGSAAGAEPKPVAHPTAGFYDGYVTASSFAMLLEKGGVAELASGSKTIPGQWGFNSTTDVVRITFHADHTTCILVGHKVPAGISTAADPGTITCMGATASWYAVYVALS